MIEINSSQVHYYFKLKHNIQNDSELTLSKLEIENLIDHSPDDIVNYVDVLSYQPLIDFISNTSPRTQDYVTRLPYPGAIEGYHIEGTPRDCISLAKQLTYFREFYVLAESRDSVLAHLLPGTSLGELEFRDQVNIYEVLPYVQVFTVHKTNPKLLLRLTTLHALYESSEFVCRLSQKVEHVERMFNESIRHVQTEIYRPYSPSSARWFKRIADFMDSREAPQLYLTHYIFGIHGKFFPRMIGAIMNSMKISKSDCILDPFCGSGTMNVEAAIRGVNSIGIDMQPLFTMMTRLKIRSMYWNDDWLRQNIERLLNDIQANFTEDYLKNPAKQMTMVDKVDVFLPKSLMRGVRNDSLAFVENVKNCIDEVGSDAEDATTRKDLQDFCRLPLAYWMRSMLKKQDPEKVFQTYSEYLWKMFYSVYYFHKFDREICNFEIGDVDVYTSDVRQLSRIEDSRLTKGEIDGIITSPPYGTAIDYIGDHVWALYALGLTKDHLKLDEESHIGSSRKTDVAEIVEKSEAFLSLPETAQKSLLDMVRNGREKKAAALYQYFVDMRTAFEQMSTVLKPGKKLVMIIGKQQSVSTQNGTITVELGATMEEIGKKKPSALEHLNSIDIELQKASERGAIPTEHIIFFKKT